MLWEEQEQTPSPLIFWLSTVLSSLPPLRFVPWLSTSSECVQMSVRTIYLEWYVQFFFRYAHVYINHCPCIPFFSPSIFPSLYLLLYLSTSISALPLSLSLSLFFFFLFAVTITPLAQLSLAFLPSVNSNLFRAAQQVWYLWSLSRICCTIHTDDCQNYRWPTFFPVCLHVCHYIILSIYSYISFTISLISSSLCVCQSASLELPPTNSSAVPSTVNFFSSYLIGSE